MVGTSAHPVLRFIRSIALSSGDLGTSDEDLLARFAAHRDEIAFATLMRRHGPMVLGVCARVLGDTLDAEDAFQVAFVVLARHARSMARPKLLANWLYGVAYRTALKAKVSAARRRAAERQVRLVAASDGLDEVVRNDFLLVLDEELSHLPEKYRIPIVLCYLDGLTQEETARRLGCPRKTITTRLARGCDRLRRHLIRRGVALSAVSLAAALQDCARAMPALLLESTIKAAATGMVPAGIAVLTKEVCMSLILSKLKRVALLLSAVCALGVPALALTIPVPAAERPQDKKPTELSPAAETDAAKEDRDALQGRWVAQSAEHDGKPWSDDEVKKTRLSVKGDRMMLFPGGEWTPLKFKLDPSKSPKTLHMTAIEGSDHEREKTVPAIYRLDKDADTLTLCWDAKDGNLVPQDFAAKDGSGLLLIVFKREEQALRPPAVKH